MLFKDLLLAMEGAGKERFVKLCTFPALLPVAEDCIRAETTLGFEDPPETLRQRLKERALPLLPTLRGSSLHFLTPKGPGAPVSIGSSRAADLRLDSLGISGVHAELVRRMGRWSLCDMESTNGTFVEGRRLPAGIPIPLGGGQYVRLGETTYLFLSPDEIFELLQRCRGEERKRELLPPTGKLLEDLLRVGLDAGDSHPFLLQVPVDGQGEFGDLDLTQQISESVIIGRKKGRSSSNLRVHALPVEGELTLGRTAGCDLVIPERSVSKQHARIRLKQGHWQLMDLESANGTFVSTNRLPAGVWTRVPLGTTLSFGAYRALFLGAEQFAQLLKHLASVG